MHVCPAPKHTTNTHTKTHIDAQMFTKISKSCLRNLWNSCMKQILFGLELSYLLDFELFKCYDIVILSKINEDYFNFLAKQ